VTVPVQRLQVESFKSLVKADVRLGRINVFIGANGSGKSNLLEALGVLGAAASGRVEDSSLKDRGVRPGVENLYKSSFRGLRRPQLIKLGAENESASYSSTLWNPSEVGSITRWRYHTERLTDGNRYYGRSPASTDFPNTDAGLVPTVLARLPPTDPRVRLANALQNFRIYSPVTHFLRYSDDPTQQDPVGLLGGGLGFAVGEFIRATHRTLGSKDYPAFREGYFRLLGWSDRIAWKRRDQALLSPSVPSGREVLTFHDRFMAKGRDWLTAHDASEGALYVLFGLVAALHPRSPEIVAIDNFDQALNPKLAKAFTHFLCTWTARLAPVRQVLLTCHNPLVLDGLPLATDDSIRLFAVDRDNRGHTVVKHLDLATLRGTKKDSQVALSRLWVMGALGGVPDV
jgi:energy-coupling factor transporter ATP-binding protein EcfA2